MIKNDQQLKYRTNAYNRPYWITKVTNNGTVQIKSGQVMDTYNIQNTMPYRKQGTPKVMESFDIAQSMGKCAIPTHLRTYLGILCPILSKCKREPAGKPKHKLFQQ
eukprot:12262920-Ditylum_brightwellii.AAC.1